MATHHLVHRSLMKVGNKHGMQMAREIVKVFTEGHAIDIKPEDRLRAKELAEQVAMTASTKEAAVKIITACRNNGKRSTRYLRDLAAPVHV